MQEQYPIADNQLMTKLREQYGIKVESLHFIPMGDSAYSYQVDCADNQRYYLKLFDGQNDRQKKSAGRLDYYLPLTWSMYEQKLFRNITYPIKTQHGEFTTTYDDLTLVLFNFIEGETLADAYPFSKEIVADIAKSVADIHRITPSVCAGRLWHETFDISFESELEKCMAHLEHTSVFDDCSKQALREYVLPEKQQIAGLLNLVRELRGKSIRDPKQRVLCHGDIWGGNIIRHERELYLVDWESAIIAPPEFDMFGYIGEDFETFFSSYQDRLGKCVPVRLDLLRFYAYRHHLRNLAGWLMNMLFRNATPAQNENDLDMIVHHCMNRWDSIESKVNIVYAVLQANK